MIALIVAGLALIWCFLLFVVFALCRAAAEADRALRERQVEADLEVLDLAGLSIVPCGFPERRTGNPFSRRLP